jgi:hypothetical protein
MSYTSNKNNKMIFTHKKYDIVLVLVIKKLATLYKINNLYKKQFYNRLIFGIY